MNIQVELTRTTDASAVAEALAAQGVQADLDDGGQEMTVRADDIVRVEHALEDWVVERGLPFVPVERDDHTIVLAPPAG